ncbi:MAG: SdpI family protein [Ferrovibrio sp.]|uniref:SdpI family protein n=1 Tax=Ferrovibrio sp. TaxID=1917215 RepID=UPI002616D6ED|nr:SdpI family protein [Ferrovibrio sp.]MCW0236260.1 SdpI family protein [Ferrovibrio sp.]
MTHDLKLSAWIGLGVTALLMLASLPMALRLVPLNRHYGLRVPAAYVSEEQWLLMNQVAGISMLIGGLLILTAGTILLKRRRQSRLGWDDKRLALVFGLLPLPVTLLSITLPYAFIS